MGTGKALVAGANHAEASHRRTGCPGGQSCQPVEVAIGSHNEIEFLQRLEPTLRQDQCLDFCGQRAELNGQFSYRKGKNNWL